MQEISGPMGPPGSKGEIGKNGGKNPKEKLVLQGQEVRANTGNRGTYLASYVARHLLEIIIAVVNNYVQ